MNRSEPEVFATIKNLFATKTRRRLFENFLSLSFLQFANYIFPLINLPYLVRVLGPEKYGLIAFAQAFIGYFQILTDYGFNLSATREISINRENKEKVSEIFSSVMIIKFFLLLLSLGLMTIIVFSFKKFRQDWLIYYLAFGMVLGQTLFPIWFFQGMERMRYITFLNVLAKLIFTIAIFIFVKRSSDYLYVPLLNSLGFIVAGILALWIVFKDFGIRFKIVDADNIYKHLKDGWKIFLSVVSGNIYGQGHTFILGLLTSNKLVGYYAAAHRIVAALVSFSQPVAQSIFPYLARLGEDKSKIKLYFYRIFKYVFALDLLLLLFLLSLSIQRSLNIYTLVTGYTAKEGIISFLGWSIIGFFTIMNVIMDPFIVSLREDKRRLKMYFLVGFSFLFFSPILTYFWSYKGMLISMFIVEVSIFTFSNIIIRSSINK
jgi:PST family polysaccharide transporter